MCHFPFLTAVDKTPGECYCPSPRPYPSRIEEPEDPQGLAARRVVDGVIRWRRQKVFVGKGLNGERVGLEEIGKWRWRVRFSFYELGLLDERKGRLLSPSALAATPARPGREPDAGRPPGSLHPGPPWTKSVTYVLGINCYLCPGLLSARREKCRLGGIGAGGKTPHACPSPDTWPCRMFQTQRGRGPMKAGATTSPSPTAYTSHSCAASRRDVMGSRSGMNS